MENHNLDVVIFSEHIREIMQLSNPPLIRHRRPFLRGYPHVFVGNEVITWALVNILLQDEFKKNKSVTEEQSLQLFQKLMDGGLLRNAQTLEGFKNDKSLYRFSADDSDSDSLVRSVAIGYRLFKRAHSPTCNLFQKVCSFGELVSAQCLKASDIAAWVIEDGLTQSRESAVQLCKGLLENKVIKSVDAEVTEFRDDGNFYLFSIDYDRKPMTVETFLYRNKMYGTENNSEDNADNDIAHARNRRIHLRQTSDQLMDLSAISSIARGSRSHGVSQSSDDSGFNDNGINLSPPTYKSLLKMDGGMTKEALLHPSAPFVKKDLKFYPDSVGYGFVIRGNGPCYIKVVDPDSPAGKAGLKATQFITDINGNSVATLPHTNLEDLILNGPRQLKITVMQQKPDVEKESKACQQNPQECVPSTLSKSRNSSKLPSAQPWIKNKGLESPCDSIKHHSYQVMTR